jgi:hypothetical protein
MAHRYRPSPSPIADVAIEPIVATHWQATGSDAAGRAIMVNAF